MYTVGQENSSFLLRLRGGSFLVRPIRAQKAKSRV
jgi:hypothetical protein